MEEAEGDKARFELYVKKSSTNGGPRGSCPFSLKAFMFMNLVADERDFRMHPVDIINKPFYMMKLNPAGTVPILVDHSAEDKVITESGDIVNYLNSVGTPKCDMHIDGQSEASQVTSQVFPKLCQYLKNPDCANDGDCCKALEGELQKVEDFLAVQSKKTRYLVSDDLTEPDCNFLPKLYQVVCAGKYFVGFEVLERYPQIKAYYEHATQEDVWKNTCPTPQDIVDGFLDHGVAKR